jgi:hypothetical protein
VDEAKQKIKDKLLIGNKKHGAPWINGSMLFNLPELKRNELI